MPHTLMRTTHSLDACELSVSIAMTLAQLIVEKKKKMLSSCDILHKLRIRLCNNQGFQGNVKSVNKCAEN